MSNLHLFTLLTRARIDQRVPTRFFEPDMTALIYGKENIQRSIDQSDETYVSSFRLTSSRRNTRTHTRARLLLTKER